MLMNAVLVTGGAGFIGSHYVKELLQADDTARVTVLDALTYAGHLDNLSEAFLDPRLTFVHGSILDAALVDQLMASHTHVVHFAAESHVDRSLVGETLFAETNVLGTQILVNAASRHPIQRFVHISTDEVYGPLPEGTATEDDPLLPTVPYAATKAASDLIALSAYRNLRDAGVRDPLLQQLRACPAPGEDRPSVLTRLLRGEPVTLHGRGEHVRNWLHVSDHCAGIDLVLRGGTPGEVYNIGGGTDLTSRELTGELLRLCGADWNKVQYIPDRRANDIRYSMAWDKIAQLGYEPRRDFHEAPSDTVQWYRHHHRRWTPPPHACAVTRPHVILDASREPEHA